MSALPIREALIARLNDLTDEELTEVLEFIEYIHSRQKITLQKSDSADPAIGFFSAEPNFAARSKEVLRREFGVRKP